MLKTKRSLFMILFSMVIALSACGGGGGEAEGEPDGEDPIAEAGKIIISGKEYTEQVIMTQILAEYLKANTDLEVDVKGSLGGVFVLQEAMQRGDIDAYVEYTGTGYLNVLKQDFVPGSDPDELFEKTNEMYMDEYNIKWLKPLGFNNTYALTLRGEHADELGVETTSDLIEHAESLTFGSDGEFYERGDGYDAMIEAYEFGEFARKVTIDPDLMYSAAKDGEIDVITAYTTDPRIPEFDLRPMEDDKDFFPPYHAVPIIRQEVLDANPGLEETINKLGESGAFTDESVSALNAEVSTEGKKANDVAIAFLKEHGLID